MSRTRRPSRPRQEPRLSSRRAAHPDLPGEARTSPRSRPALRAAVRLDPDRERRLEALAAYSRAVAETTPEDDGSLGGLKRAIAEDLHLIFEGALHASPRPAGRSSTRKGTPR